ncbi:hypothetical protein ABZ023_25775 [Streptomyces sp. NPDC006367]|uniref:hypothetical protein n=1 Tax=unclassified Streptomyces TaxID=2593676 RepID=UPI0033B7B648
MPMQQEHFHKKQFDLGWLLPRREAVREGWQYANLDALLLAHGRWFTPHPLPSDVAPGEPGKCYRDSVTWALKQRPHEVAYVEGFADDLFAARTPHAWCSRTDARVIDRTWDPVGLAYIGLPLQPEAAQSFMDDNGTWSVLFAAEGLVSATTEAWMRHGVPDGVLMDVGLPLSPASAVHRRR